MFLISCLQGMHQVAQKLTRVTLPFKRHLFSVDVANLSVRQILRLGEGADAEESKTSTEHYFFHVMYLFRYRKCSFFFGLAVTECLLNGRLMFEMSHAGDDHRQFVFYAIGNTVFIADTTTRLYKGGNAFRMGHFYAIVEREKGIRG